MNACGGAWSPTPHRAPPLRVAVAALARAAPGRFDVVGRVVRDVEEVRAVGAHRPDVCVVEGDRRIFVTEGDRPPVRGPVRIELFAEGRRQLPTIPAPLV